MNKQINKQITDVRNETYWKIRVALYACVGNTTWKEIAKPMWEIANIISLNATESFLNDL